MNNFQLKIPFIENQCLIISLNATEDKKKNGSFQAKWEYERKTKSKNNVYELKEF